MCFVRTIVFENYKRFERFEISCRRTNVLVGPNNSGKSTALDALRIFGSVHRYAGRTVPLYREHEGYGGCATYELSHGLIGLPMGNVVRDYGDDFAKIAVALDNGSTMHIHLHPDHTVIAFLQTDRSTPRTTTEYRRAIPLSLIIVPTLSALEEDEEYVLDTTAARNENTRLASRNFRNIVLRKSLPEFEKFAALASAGWTSVEIFRPEVVRQDRAYVRMMYSEKRIPREVYWSGFGFQVWMQMMLQFLRGDKDAILVLDEPDIYLHPDLQRRIFRMSKDRFGQIFVATHSTEIVREADRGDILLVNSANNAAERIASGKEYSTLFSYIGSSR